MTKPRTLGVRRITPTSPRESDEYIIVEIKDEDQLPIDNSYYSSAEMAFDRLESYQRVLNNVG
jgi:hypothetical protein